MWWIVCVAFLLLLLQVAAANAEEASLHHPHEYVIDYSPSQISSDGFVITSIFPQSGPTSGGTDMQLMGSSGDIDSILDHGDELQCVFFGSNNNNGNGVGGDAVLHTAARWMSPTEIKCATPEWSDADVNVTLGLALDGIGIATYSPSLSPFYYYYNAPIIKSIFPSFGSALGGTTITLRGLGFLPMPDMICRLGVVDVPATWIGDDEVICTSPPGVVATTQQLSLSLNGVDFSSSPTMYRYTESPLVLSVRPIKGRISGGSTLIINGKGFEDSPEMKCIFHLHNNHALLFANAEYISTTQMKCASPRVEEPTRATVFVDINGVDTSTSGARFEFIEDAVVDSIRPASGPINGGTLVSLRGSGMMNGDSLSCRFGENAIVPGFCSEETSGFCSEEIQCISPPVASDGPVNVTLSLNGEDYTDSSVGFMYFEHPTITSIFPKFGASTGGTEIQLRGSGFLACPDLMCRVGSIHVPASFVSENEVSCVSPGGSTGSSHNISVSLNGIDFPPSSVEFLYRAPVEVHKVHPKWSDEAGGKTLTVYGLGFEDTGELACIFSSRQGDPVFVQAKYSSSTELQCTAPPKTANGDITLRITVNGVDISPNDVHFEYVAAAIVSSTTPDRGPVMGGTPVFLSGEGFLYEDTTCCQFGDVIVPAEWMSWTVVRCISPPSSAGDVLISYSNDGMNFVSTGKRFSFCIPATVKRIEPNSGSREGQTEVRIFGEGFTDEPGWACLFNKTSALATFSSPSEIRCSTPASYYADECSLSLLDPKGSVSETGVNFHYFVDLHLMSYFPESSPSSGGTTVVIEVQGLQLDTSYKCVFGELEVAVTLHNATTIKCITPMMESQGESTLTVQSNTNIAITTESANFTFYEPPVINSASPTSIYSGFSTVITVFGKAFPNSKHLKCRLGKHDLQARWISEKEIVCHHSSQSIEPQSQGLVLSMSINGVDFHGSGTQINIYPDFTVSSISPSSGYVTDVLAKGTGFQDTFAYRCLFGMKFVSARLLSPKELLCQPEPLYLPGTKSVWICLDGGDCVGGGDLAFEFLNPLDRLDLLSNEDLDFVGTVLIDEGNGVGDYASLNAVHVSHISPAVGLTGTTVSVFGRGFEYLEDAVCRFGPKQAPVSIISNSSIACTAPGRPIAEESVVSFKVVDSSGHVEIYSNDESMTFTYVDLRLTRVEPVVIEKTNSSMTTIEVEGHNLDILSSESFQCRVGSSIFPAKFHNSSGKVTCDLVGLFETGKFSVELLSEQFGVLSSSQVKVRVVEPIHLSHLEPAIAVASNRSTLVMVKGANFVEHGSICFFDGQKSQAMFISNSEVLCSLPKNSTAHHYEVSISNNGGFQEQSQHLTMEVISPASISLVVPPAGQPESNVTIRGKSFHPRMKCQFGSRRVETVFHNSTFVQCIVPIHAEQGPVSVDLTLNGVPVTSGLPALFTVVDLSVISVHPRFGDINGGTRVSLGMEMQSLAFVSHCIFGDDITPAIIEESGLVCLSPATLKAGPVSIGVSVDGEEVVKSYLTFEFTEQPVFTNMHPKKGSESGGTLVTLTGSHFVKSKDIVCYFSDIVAAGRWISEDTLVCETPATKPGSYTVKTTLNGVDVHDTHQIFNVYPHLTALLSSPPFGETGGGSLIRIHGTNFRQENSLTCRFGHLLVEAEYVETNMVECVSPKWAVVESVDLTIMSDNGDSATLDARFEFYTPFTLSSIHPNIGFTRGGTSITVMGDHFTNRLDPAQCIFDGIAVDADVVSSSEIVCSSPPARSSGDVEFSLTHGSDKFVLPLIAFEYEDEIILEALSPEVVPSIAERVITVHGTVFRDYEELACKVSSNSNEMLVESTFVNEFQVLCRIPKGLMPREYNLTITNNGQDFSANTLTFSVIDPILVKAIQPTMGSPDTLQVVSLEGANFQAVEPHQQYLSCLVDGKYIVASNFVNTTSIECSLPPMAYTGAVSIELILNGVQISTGIPVFFTFIDLSLTSISPVIGDVTGGTRVTFYLKEVSPDKISHCIFGDVIAPAIVGQSELVCVTPPIPTVGPVHVGVSVNGEHFRKSHLTFEYTDKAEFDSIYPQRGSETGGTVVSITGSKFMQSNKVACFFGGVKVAGRWISDSKLICETPAMKPSNYKVKVTLNGVDTLRTSLQFTFLKEIDVLYTSPSSGSFFGGTEISIIGKSFVSTENLTCQFGDFDVSKAAFVSSTEVTCVTPDVSKATLSSVDFDVRISLNGVDYSPASAPFRFTPRAAIHSIYPDQGSISGGSEVSVKGNNFFSSISSNTAICIFGSITVPASILSSEELTCVSPPASVDGEISLLVSLNGVDLIQHRAILFHYLPNAKAMSIEPSGGPFTGGTLVTVRGHSFGKALATSCKFGSLSSDGIVYISEDTIQCMSPIHPSGTVDFSVVTASDEVVSDVVFVYYKPPVILFASPSSGPHQGKTPVRIYGNDFRSNVDYLCYFGDTQVSGQYLATDAIECLSPRARLDSEQYNVTLLVAEKNTNFTTANPLLFTYEPSPSLDSILPRHVFFDGGDIISVFVSRLDTTTNAWCRFSLPSTDGAEYHETVQATSIVNDGHIKCQVPSYDSVSNAPVEAFVEVSTNGWDWSASRLSVMYTPAPTMHSIHPALGSVDGSTIVTISGSDFIQESNLWCAFGNSSVPTEWRSSTHISCKAPRASYPVNVPLSLHFDDSLRFINGAHLFTYHRQLSLEQAHPMRGFVSGGTVVTVEGTGFLDAPTLLCRFDSTIVQAKFISSNFISCVAPLTGRAQGIELKVSLNGMDFSSLLAAPRGKLFRYDNEVDLFQTIPSSVPVTANAGEESGSITIVGSSFINTTSLACRFGQDQVVSAQFVSVSEMRCQIPEQFEPGESIVRVSLNGVDFSRKYASISYFEPAIITSVSPQVIQEGSQVEILVMGDNFLPLSDLQCHFGRHGHFWSPARWIDDSSIKCVSPPLNLTHDGVEYIGVSNNGGHDSGRKLFTVGVTARAQFLSMHPAVGYVDGGTEVTITLGNVKYLAANMVCQFGMEAIPAKLLSANSVVCTAPAYQAGVVTVKLVSDEYLTLAAGQFEYFPVPFMESLKPMSGPLDGGTTISITGSGLSGVTHCRFGVTNYFKTVEARVRSDSSLRCDAPAWEEDVDATIEVTHNRQDFAGIGRVFRYRANPRLFSLEPNFGSDLGGKDIRVIGENFVDTPTHCRFGTHLVNAIFISPTLLSCIAPRLMIGQVPVSMTTNGVDFISNETVVYESVKLPQIKIGPTIIGPVNGNTTVVLQTTALTIGHRLACNFGDVAVPALHVSTNSASCLAPTLGVIGSVNVSLSVDGEHYLAEGTNTVEFEYVPEPKIGSIFPNFGWKAGGGQVSLSATNLEPFVSYDISCSFGDSSVFTTALQVGNHLVSCGLPIFHEKTMQQHAPITLRISNGLNVFEIKTPVFSYHEPAVVTSVDPPVGSVRGGSLVKVSGINFSNMHGLQCLWGKTAVDATFLSEREITCVSPVWKGGPKKLDVHIGIKGGPKLTLASHASFAHLPHPAIQDIQPQYGSINGGTLVTLRGHALSWPEASKQLSCRFGNSTLVPVVATNNGDLTCISPAFINARLAPDGEKRSLQVSLYANHGQVWLASSDVLFVYANHIEIGTVIPSSGPLEGGTVVTISTHGLQQLPIDEITCHFGSEVAHTSYDEDQEILKCRSPAIESSSPAKTVMLNLGINGKRDVPSVGKLFTYYRPPSVLSISPTFGFLEGGEDVMISGHYFRKGVGLSCLFGDVVAPKTTWLSDTTIRCISPVAANTTEVAIRVTNNGADYSDEDRAPQYSFTHRPDASKVEPAIVQWYNSTIVTVTGKGLAKVSSCRYGNSNKTYPAFNITNNSMQCKVPPATKSPLSFLPSISQSKVPIYLELENGIFPAGLDIKYEKPHPKLPDMIKQPKLTSISSNHGSSNGNDWIRVYGDDFLNTRGLACAFGEQLIQDVRFVSASEVHCRSPRHLPGIVKFDVINGESREEKQSSVFEFTFVSDVSITSIYPSNGSIKGGTQVHVFGSFPYSSSLGNVELGIKCKFGMSGVVQGELKSQNEVRCQTPSSSMVETVEVRVSFDGGNNFADSATWFAYEHESEIDSLTPSYGYPSGGSMLVVSGRHYRNSTSLTCLFDQVSAQATFLSSNKVSCEIPPHPIDTGSKVSVRLSYDGEIGSSWKYFEYIEMPQITAWDHRFGEAEVTVRGAGFRNVLGIVCAFGKVKVRATVIDGSKLLCPIPQHEPGVVDFYIIDQYALSEITLAEGLSSHFHFYPETSVYSVYPTWNVTRAGSLVFAKGTNFDAADGITCAFGDSAISNAIVMADSLLSCPIPSEEIRVDGRFSVRLGASIHSDRPHAVPLESTIESPAAPNGTITGHNVTLCEPGTFKPRAGEGQCHPCPIGFICPLFGMAKPILCPAGSICERLSLVVPSSACVNGHYCSKGTKMSSRIAESTTENWILEDESGVLTTAMSNSAWDFISRESPATGYYCREGVATTKHRELDYSTPQPCFDGYFCSRGSTMPEGAGACPTGFYCPNQTIAVHCDVGNYCPGVGNVIPLPCFPGSYSSAVGESNCKLCEIGNQCPGFERAAPEPCEAGWVCDEEGLSVPWKRCPSGYVCVQGTTTDDLTSLFGQPPLPCPPGSFCLEGVAHNVTAEWLPSFELGALAPQPCSEGYFCPSNSSSPIGGGKCFPGHYCPEGSPYPVETPPGSFFGEDGGAIVGSLCLPGTFSPRPGQVSCSPCPAGSSCLSYGTYVPRICGPGTYRSKADATQCKPCPERTFSFASGMTDISQCLPCAEGRVCGSQGMTDLEQSDACSEGSVCGYMTDRVTQFANQCPSGSYCGNETTTLNQYSNHCLRGSYCERGTTSKVKTSCGKSHYCTLGTPNPEPSITRCPRQTTSLAGAKNIDFCRPSLVAICDKMPVSEDNPFEGLSYHPLKDTVREEEASVEMLVVEKVLPFNQGTSNIVLWKNDTLEVFRTCPTYGILPGANSLTQRHEELTVIGRNFYNGTTLTCRYRLCQGSSWVTDDGERVIVPGYCQSNTSNMNEPITELGTYISSTRVSCPMPNFDAEDDLQLLNVSNTEMNPSDQLCLRDDTGQIFLSQRCSSSDLSLGNCAFEKPIPLSGLRKRIYSLTIPCSDDDMLNGLCADTHTDSSRLNPCLTQKMVVDVSNSGKKHKFSGDTTNVPYESLGSQTDNSLDADNSHQVPPTHAVYEYILEDDLNMLQLESNADQKNLLISSFEGDHTLCRRSSMHEEGWRNIEDGWFEAPYMSQFHLSLDWRHLPNHLVYDEHFKLAIFVVPSRCQESTCKDSGRDYGYVENVPCLQPVQMPVWFTDESIDKNQMMNMTLTSLDDSRFRVEVQITNGLMLPVADFFKRTLSVVMEHPQRANTIQGSKRNISPLVSYEEKPTDMPWIFGIKYDAGNSQALSLPRNLPPRWKAFERGRVLLGMNSTHENEAPTIKDGNGTIPEGSDFWDNPHQSPTRAKQQSDLYFETFHGVSTDGPAGSYKYEHESLILPYLPYFSNCREFDSHVPLWAVVESASRCRLPDETAEFPENWWRREIPPLPHQDDIISVGPYEFVKFYPIADHCERKLYCNYEEDLPNPNVSPRWFEADSGTALFSIIRDPIDYYQYTGRDSSVIGSNDGGGQRYIDSIDTLQTFIPAKVDRSPALNIEGGCTTACFPRKVTLDISYQQVDVHTKRIVQVRVLYDKFDKDSSNDDYELQVKFYALNYQELVIKFAFSRGIFLLLFSQIGVGTVIAAFCYWLVVRITTNLERPPHLRITGFLYLTFPSALGGFLLGLLPISIVTSAVYYLMKGYTIFTQDTDPEGRRWLFPSSTRLQYSDSAIDPDSVQSTRQGRTGLAFITMALISLYFTSKVFVPKSPPGDNATEKQGNEKALVNWKRGNLICSSVVISLFLVIIVEWSFWSSFGTYIWEAIIFMKVLSIFIGSIVDKQLGEALLSAPVMTAMGLVQGIVTMSANDFMDFLLSYIVGFGFLILERMYIGPMQAETFGQIHDIAISWVERLRASFPSVFGGNQDLDSADNNPEDVSVPSENNETVEPLLGSYASYSCDTLSMLYTPFIMVVIMAFRDEAEITKLYGIKELDMEYYVLFALAIIPFQIIADILLHNSLELLHGWKIHEYLEYCRVRFQQREVWWKGLERNTVDECIEESLRSMDQYCFSTQYYMLNTIHVNAMIYLVMGVEMMTRADYTVFGDPALIPIVSTIILFSLAVKFVLTWFARIFGLWKIKYEKRSWHANVIESEGNPNLDQWDDINTKGHDNHVMEHRISSETFRYKFLSYNRSWILSQLPDMITPRVTATQRPYMINQFARILGQVGGDISSDSDSDSEHEFKVPAMTASTRTLARTWLDTASRQLRLRKLVQPLIHQSRGNECMICLSRNLLQVETLHSISDIDEQFKTEYDTSEIDQVLFKRFWQRNQRYQTICLPCVQKRKNKEHEGILLDDRSSDDGSVDIDNKLSTVDMTQSAESIMARWHAEAQRRLAMSSN